MKTGKEKAREDAMTRGRKGKGKRERGGNHAARYVRARSLILNYPDTCAEEMTVRVIGDVLSCRDPALCPCTCRASSLSLSFSCLFLSVLSFKSPYIRSSMLRPSASKFGYLRQPTGGFSTRYLRKYANTRGFSLSATRNHRYVCFQPILKKRLSPPSLSLSFFFQGTYFLSLSRISQSTGGLLTAGQFHCHGRQCIIALVME